MEPTFPLRIAPACHQCGNPCIREITQPSNKNGNALRPYYTCVNVEHPRKFSTFDDSQGIVRGNPHCRCGYTSRRVRRNEAGQGEFYCCPAGRCRWSDDVPATRAIRSDGSWSGETITDIGTGGNQSREATPETHTNAAGAGYSYIKAPGMTTIPAAGNGGRWHEAQTFGSGTRPVDRNRHCYCCVIM